MEKGNRQPIRFEAKVLRERQHEYTQVKRELWGVVLAIKSDRDYLIEVEVVIETDCLLILEMMRCCLHYKVIISLPRNLFCTMFKKSRGKVAVNDILVCSEILSRHCYDLYANFSKIYRAFIAHLPRVYTQIYHIYFHLYIHKIKLKNIYSKKRSFYSFCSQFENIYISSKAFSFQKVFLF
jgi:hypothetical protein